VRGRLPRSPLAEQEPGLKLSHDRSDPTHMEERVTQRQWAPAAARIWFGLTAAVVLVAVTVSVVMVGATVDDGFTRPFSSAFVRGLNAFVYFTLQSNIIVGVTTLLLALRLDRTSTLFRVFRLDGLIMIVVTGTVYHTMLSGLLELHGWSSVGNQLVHTVVPIMAVLGWLVVGPRGAISWRAVGLSVVYPIAWVVFTMTRGALTDWYPYPFLDVGEIGVLRVSLYLLGITAAFLLLAAGALLLDRALVRLGTRQSETGSVDTVSQEGR